MLPSHFGSASRSETLPHSLEGPRPSRTFGSASGCVPASSGPFLAFPSGSLQSLAHPNPHPITPGDYSNSPRSTSLAGLRISAVKPLGFCGGSSNSAQHQYGQKGRLLRQPVRRSRRAESCANQKHRSDRQLDHLCARQRRRSQTVEESGPQD